MQCEMQLYYENVNKNLRLCAYGRRFHGLSVNSVQKLQFPEQGMIAARIKNGTFYIIKKIYPRGIHVHLIYYYASDN